ncbi:hypothetical protein [Haliea sp. E17]|uniref:hypothetical protein n=1 Tax=Haliea sp. E17 TaxID=3401576 RepID=UPI003AABBB39
MNPACLPDGFDSLAPFVTTWVLPDASARMQQRQSAPMEAIQSFYDAMTPLGDSALAYLSQLQLGELPPEAENLLGLMLSLAEIAPAVEWYGSPEVANGYPVNRIHYLRQIPDLAAQA